MSKNKDWKGGNSKRGGKKPLEEERGGAFFVDREEGPKNF